MSAFIIQHAFVSQSIVLIKGPSELKSAYIKTFNDHRIAMAFSVAGFISKSKVELDKPSCVSVSYPEFFDTLYKLMT